MTLLRLLLVLRVFVAVALFVRLAGAARDWLPDAPVLLAALAGLAAADWLLRAGAFRRGWWRALAHDHAFAIALGAILVAALAARLAGIGSDLGHQRMDIDEHRLADNIKAWLVTGSVGHYTVEHYPGIVFWVLSAAAMLMYLQGLMAHAFLSIGEMPLEDVVLVGRVANACIGAATVAVTAALGHRLGGPAAGLLAAGLLAVAPLAISVTTSMRNDAGQVLLLALAAWSALALLDRGTRSWAATAGALAGLATAVKYTSVFALIPVLLAAALAGVPATRRARLALVALAAFGLSLATTNHFLWADVPTFMRQLSDQIAITGRGHWAATENPAAAQLGILTRFGPGWPVVILAAGWGVVMLSRGSRVAWVFCLLPVLYSWFTTQRPSQLPRWVYPLFPFVAAAGAAALVVTVRGLASRSWTSRGGATAMDRVAAAVLIVAALGPAAWVGAVAIGRRLTTPTQFIAERWVRESARPGTVVLLEDGWLDLRDTPVHVLRVPDLRRVLDGHAHVLAAADWIVVPEPFFGHARLRDLSLLTSVTADQRSPLGNMGLDYRVYAIPRSAPVESVAVRPADPASAPFLGREWPRGDGHPHGSRLPPAGASLFTPPLAASRVTLEIETVGGRTSAGVPPVVVALGDATVPLVEAPSQDQGVRRATGTASHQAGDRGLHVRLTTARPRDDVRVVSVRIAGPAAR